jgi:hypothetical protein
MEGTGNNYLAYDETTYGRQPIPSVFQTVADSSITDI